MSDGVQSPGDGSRSALRLTVHPDLSLSTRLLQRTLKPLRPRLVAPPKQPWPAGSNRLDAPSAVKKKCNVEERNRQGIFEYELTAKSVALPLRPRTPDRAAVEGKSKESTSGVEGRHRHHHHRLYYFAGGGFQSVPNPGHWRLVAEIARRLNRPATGTKDARGKGGDGEGDDGDGGGVRVGHVRAFIVSNPLAPSSPAAESLRALRTWLEDLLDEAVREGFTVTLAGDSSGGNIAISLALGAAGGWPSTSPKPSSSASASSSSTPADKSRDQPGTDAPSTEHQDGSAVSHQQTTDANATESAGDDDDPLSKGRSPNAAALTHALLICPAVDMRNSNPDMHAAERHDCILTQPFTATVARVWIGAQDTTAHGDLQAGARSQPPQLAAEDARVSPLLADLSGLASAAAVASASADQSWPGMTVDGLIGGRDVLAPDARLFAAKLEAAGVRGDWHTWDRMMHCWPLTWWGGFPEARASLAWAVERVQAVAARGSSAQAGAGAGAEAAAAAAAASSPPL